MVVIEEANSVSYFSFVKPCAVIWWILPGLVILPSCHSAEVNLLTINKSTYINFADVPSPYEYEERNQEEVESAFEWRCEDGDWDRKGALTLYELLTSDNLSRWERLSQVRACEAYSSRVPFDEMPWDSKSHGVRQRHPKIWLSIEAIGKDRFRAPDENSLRELDQGTDLFDDWYFDTVNGLLLEHNWILRGRLRWRGARPSDRVELRRLLVQAKKCSEHGSKLLKVAQKYDVRREHPNHREIWAFLPSIKRGLVGWYPATYREPLPLRPVRKIWSDLDRKRVLPRNPNGNEVLELRERAFVRSVRSRYHLVETSLRRINEFLENGYHKTSEFLILIRRRLDAPKLSKGQRAALISLYEEGKTLLKTKFQLHPDLRPKFEDVAALDSLQAKANKLNSKFKQFAANLAKHKSTLGWSARDAESAIHVQQYKRWKTPASRLSAAAQKIFQKRKSSIDVEVNHFNAFLKEQSSRLGVSNNGSFKPISRDKFKRLGNLLWSAHFDEGTRQIEAAGSAALGILHDFSCYVYVGYKRDPNVNIMIDTLDLSAYYPKDAWGIIPIDLQHNQYQPDKSKRLGATLINEVQLELSFISLFKNRLRQLHSREMTPEVVELIAGTEKILESYKRVIQTIAKIKEPSIRSQLTPLGFVGGAWKPSVKAKGLRALRFTRKG